MRLFASTAFVLASIGGIARADRPVDLVVGEPKLPLINTPAIPPYNTIFLNRCASGCSVTGPGTTDSRIDKSEIVSGNHVLTKFTYGDATWASVVSCVKDTFEGFNVTITDTDPGSASHFEIMVGGEPSDLGFPANVGGVSPNGCGQTYIPNALVFDFADVWSTSATTCNQNCIEDICSTAAQEIAHSFGLDHSTNSKDPMTYYSYGLRKYFQNEADACGSDCVSGKGPMGNTCSGTNSQSHTCCVNEGTTQNSFQSLLTLFGPGTPTPPIVAITSPRQGASVQAGFPVQVTATDDSMIQNVSMTVDGVAVMPVLTTGPYAFNAPATLTPGNHVVVVTAIDAHGTPGSGTVTVTIGPPCTDASMCLNATDACIDGRCVPGPGVAGGLGTACTMNTDCGDSTCASDGTNMYCTSTCMGPGECPSGFGCLPAMDGSTAGFCWPGYNDQGGGGCNAGAGGQVGGGLVLGALLLTRRRKRQ